MTLTQLFTNIANAIRAKTGSSETIKAEDFANEIEGIPTGITPTGEIEITENGQVDVTNYASANVNVSSGGDASEYFNDTISPGSGSGNNAYPGFALSIKKLPPGLVAGTSTSYMFNRCSSLEEVTNLDTSNTTNMSYMFRSCGKLHKIVNLDTKKVTDFSYMFYSCSRLASVPLFDMSASNISLNYMFQYCGNLVDVPQFNTSNVSYMANIFQGCTKLSNESLNNILAMCINATSYNNTKTLAYIGLTSTQADTCQTLSNWNEFVTAGWTTGY